MRSSFNLKITAFYFLLKISLNCEDVKDTGGQFLLLLSTVVLFVIECLSVLCSILNEYYFIFYILYYIISAEIFKEQKYNKYGRLL